MRRLRVLSSPERGRANLVRRRGVFGSREDGDGVARPQIVQEKVAVWMDDFIAQSLRDDERAAVDE
jgi:hypothetical protein